MWRTKGDNQDFGPIVLDLMNQFAAFFCVQINQEHGWTFLLQDGVEPIRLGDVAHLAHHAQKSLCSSPEFLVLAVENGSGRKIHAATSSRSNRTTGSRMWKAVPLVSSLSTSICPPCSSMIP